MPFVIITDPVEAHRYRQVGMLWLYSECTLKWLPITSEVGKKCTLEQQVDNMYGKFRSKYAILVESED